MMRSTRTATRSGALVAAIAAITLLAGCAVGAQAPQAPGTPTTSTPGSPPASSPISSAPESTPASATADPAATGPAGADELPMEAYATPNGTAVFGIPTTWTFEVHSQASQNHDGEQQWMNSVELIDDEGRSLITYNDGSMSDAGTADATWAVLDQRPIAGSPDGEQLSALTWWIQVEGGAPLVEAAVAPPTDDAPFAIFREVEGRNGIFTAELDELEICAAVTDVASAEACLASPEVAEVMQVLASLEVLDAPWDAMP